MRAISRRPGTPWCTLGGKANCISISHLSSREKSCGQRPKFKSLGQLSQVPQRNSSPAHHPPQWNGQANSFVLLCFPEKGNTKKDRKWALWKRSICPKISLLWVTGRQWDENEKALAWGVRFFRSNFRTGRTLRHKLIQVSNLRTKVIKT